MSFVFWQNFDKWFAHLCQDHQRVQPSFSDMVVSVSNCGPDEFECNYPADGCILWDKVYDGKIDCLRDGHDESNQTRYQVAWKLFPSGENTFYNLIHKS